MTARRGRISLSQEYAPYWLSNAQWSVSIGTIHAQPAETDSAGCTYIYLHMHICDNNNEWPQESSWEGQGEKIKVGSDKFYFN